ncbi:AfsR/SARP family transcriptional regulator [Actinomadura viridis]|uniref:DNA-binding SARP family transcriptional activator n=1 Tax=Actinomadura viridis TaxID=58110 RepID=A0A931GKN8_9ACTN|nr:AfsR/SARP family transcriptional regulator [Actinomadura viridis]MBG6090557.1 DNA-binding SARP family transcriptional activator [Actinomadura viridis]
MEFRVLGPVEIVDGGANVVPTALKPRQVISLLILRRDSVVSTAELIDELWDGDPPANAVTTLQTYVYKLRQALSGRGSGDVLVTRPGGYMLAASRNATVDLDRFEGGTAEGRALLEGGEPRRAAGVLRGALELWRGPALVDVAPGRLLTSYVTGLEELRSQALELRIQADLRLGRHRELVGELKSLVLTHTLHEHLHALLMIALDRSGRRHEALGVYRTLRENMIEQLGLEPGQDIRHLHQRLLSDTRPPGPAEPAGSAVPAAAVVPARPSPPPVPARARQEAGEPGGAAGAQPVRPAQLPADLADFTGRTAIVREVTGLLGPAAGARPAATPVIVITGMPGAGKTALAVRLGHLLKPALDGGQLYAELRGSAGGGPGAAEVLGGFLRDLGVPDSRIPGGLEARGRLFRSVAAGRRLLVLLDDAATAAEVRALLPGDPGCVVLVTSRRGLHGLGGARRIGVGPLEPAESVELLARIIGPARPRREPAAADRLAELCGGLPTALRCVGGRLAMMPGRSLAAMAGLLEESPRPLDELRLEDLDVRGLYDSAYAALDREDQALFRLLAMLPNAAFTAGEAVEVLGGEARTVERALERLVGAHLLAAGDGPGDPPPGDPPPGVPDGAPGEGPGDTVRYAFSRPAWVYARERLALSLSRPGHGRPRLPPIVDGIVFPTGPGPR